MSISSDPAQNGGREPVPGTSAAWKVSCAGIVGNVLEWYDFAVYGYFAPSIGKHFFPSDSPASQLIASFGVFAAGFLMRPLGGLVFGYIGDRIGRNQALILSILAMALPTFLIGVLPGHATLGLLAPLLLVLLRMIQGLSVGGEFTTSSIYLVEVARHGHRGLAASLSPFGATAGVLLGSAVGAAATRVMSQADLDAWGWRVPFLLGLVVGIGGLLVRRHLPEPAASSSNAPSVATSPVVTAFQSEWRTIVRLVCLNAFLGVGFYLSFVFAVTYLEEFVHISASRAFDINTASMAVLLAAIPIGAALSDLLGRKPLLVASSAGGLLLGWPLLWMMHQTESALIVAGQMGLALLVGAFGGTLPATMAESLPRHVRCTAVSFAYNLSVGVLGGATPLVATYLIYRSHDDLSPAYFLMASAALSLGAALTLRETSQEKLRTR